MGTRSDYKKMDGLSCWDLDKGCRHIVNQSSPGRRRLKKVLRRQARKRENKKGAMLYMVDVKPVNWISSIAPGRGGTVCMS